jgi:2-oxoglutarate ferredoxin oxidoreductase subunit alpha
VAFVGARSTAAEIAAPYKRYALAANGVSPMALPGTRGGQYTADGLTHTERGTPTSGAGDHQAQLDKRRDKLEHFNFGDHWATIEGTGPLVVLTWGSVTGAAREAIELAKADGIDARLIAPRLLAPARPEQMAKALEGAERILIVEQSHSAQFHRYLKAHYDLPAPGRVFNRAGPLPITAGELHRVITEWR